MQWVVYSLKRLKPNYLLSLLYTQSLKYPDKKRSVDVSNPGIQDGTASFFLEFQLPYLLKITPVIL